MRDRKKYLKYRTRFKNKYEYGTWMRMECPLCGKRRMFYFDKYDADCCMDCDVWFTANCNDPNCQFCSNRPSTPSEALALLEERKDKYWRRQNYQHKNDGKLRHMRKRELYDKISKK